MQQAAGVDALLHALARQARWLLDFQHCAVTLRAGAAYRLVVLHGAPSASSGQPTEAEAQVLAARHPLLLERAATDTPAGMQSALVLPLDAGAAAVGVLSFYHPQANRYNLDDLRIGGALALHLGLLLHNTELFAAARRARDELHTVLESIDDAVLVLSSAGRVTLMNRALRALAGIPATTPAGCRALWLLRTAGRRTPLVERQELRAVVAAWNASPSGASGRMQRTDGRWLEWASVALAGDQAGYVVTLRDISERVSLEELREDMAHMLVHDLRTPLTSMLMGLDFLERANLSSDPGDRSELLGLTHNAALRMLDQVNTILDVNKLEAGKLALDLTPTPMHVLAEQAMSAIQSIAQQQQIVFTLHAPTELPLVLADPSLLRRVFENLLGNALKWSPPKSAVAIDLHAADGALEVQVRDAGPGVPEELRARIFEKYGGASRREQRPGTGLGLAFCKFVVEAHGGRIGVRPAANGGSVFWFQLPLS